MTNGKFTLGVDGDDRVSVLIDGQSLFNASKEIGIQVDFKRLHDMFVDTHRIKKMMYFASAISILDADGSEFCQLQPLFDWLDYNGYNTITKPIKMFNDRTDRTVYSRHVLVDLTTAAFELKDETDHYVMFINDADYTSMVRSLSRSGKRITIVSALSMRGHSDELRRAADVFVDLASMANTIAKKDAPPRDPIQD